MSSSLLYPFQCTRYCVPFPCFLCFLIASISYSSSSLMISGSGGGVFFYFWNFGSLHFVNKLSLKTLWIIQVVGNFSSYVLCPIALVISKGPYLLLSNFTDPRSVWIFLASSHTLSPFIYVLVFLSLFIFVFSSLFLPSMACWVFLLDLSSSCVGR